MAITIAVIFEDQTERAIRDFGTLGEAIDEALTLADKHGDDLGDGHGPPRCVNVVQNGTVITSITVFRGGLLPGEAPH